MGSAIGRTIREFRHASSDMADAVKVESQTATPGPSQPNTLRDEATPNVPAAPVAPNEPAAPAAPNEPVAPVASAVAPESGGAASASGDPAQETAKADSADQA
jgi:hypothetical protein